MGCCVCKKWLKLLAGLAFILISAKILMYDWLLVLGIYFALVGLLPMVCKCDGCMGCEMPMKKKK